MPRPSIAFVSAAAASLAFVGATFANEAPVQLQSISSLVSVIQPDIEADQGGSQKFSNDPSLHKQEPDRYQYSKRDADPLLPFLS
jgi:hypothetical protein